jgi:biopolymer transport protein ExbD
MSVERALRPRLGRPARASAVISLTPMVDVLLILVVFFLVTSTYLDLDMIPMSETGGEAASAGPSDAGGGAASAGAVLVRIAPDGRAFLGGRALAPGALEEAIRARLAARPDLRVLLLPSPLAPTQGLVDALGAAARAGASDARVVRLAPSGSAP